MKEKVPLVVSQNSLTMSLMKQHLEFRHARQNHRSKIVVPGGVKQIIFSHFFLFMSWEAATKQLMTDPTGNGEFCFRLTSTFRVSGKLILSAGLVIECLIISLVVPGTIKNNCIAVK